MSLLPESASFEERVVDCFLTLRGRGLEVSALDRPVLTAWAQAGVPFEVVARGLQLAAEKALWDAVPGAPLLRSLRGCRRTVDAEIRRHLRHAAGGRESGSAPVGPGAWELERIRGLQEEVESWLAAEPGLSTGAAPVLRLLAAPGHAADVLARCEDAVALGMLRALPPPVRRNLWSSVQAALAEAPHGSAASRRLARRTRLLAAVRARLGRTGDAR